jgi:hypothetical protein
VRSFVNKHDFDAAWKSILEAFEIEIVELLFPEILNKIAWELGTESLDKELQEIQKEIYDKDSSDKVISDKIIKVRLKDLERVLKLLNKKFKGLDEDSKEKIRDLDSEKLNIIIEEILDIESLRDVERYII